MKEILTIIALFLIVSIIILTIRCSIGRLCRKVPYSSKKYPEEIKDCITSIKHNYGKYKEAKSVAAYISAARCEFQHDSDSSEDLSQERMDEFQASEAYYYSLFQEDKKRFKTLKKEWKKNKRP